MPIGVNTTFPKKEVPMFKFVFPALVCAAMCLPTMAAAQDCGCCEPDPCAKTRKKLVCVEVQKERCRLKRACVTDECGCTKKKFVRTKECVTVKRLKLVDVAVDPCKPSCMDKIRGKMAGLKARCGARKSCCEPAPCGCEAPACGCAAPAPCGCN